MRFKSFGFGAHFVLKKFFWPTCNIFLPNQTFKFCSIYLVDVFEQAYLLSVRRIGAGLSRFVESFDSFYNYQSFLQSLVKGIGIVKHGYREYFW